MRFKLHSLIQMLAFQFLPKYLFIVWIKNKIYKQRLLAHRQRNIIDK